MKLYLFAAVMLFSAVAFGQTTAFDTIQIKVNDCVTKSQWDELLVTAPELITAEPTKADGYFYTALAFYKLQENDKALEYLAMAEQLSDEPFKTKIAALKVDIANGTKASKMAETINKNGEDKNAADEYRKLWEMDKTKIEFALNAVELYVEKENYVAALEILNAPSLASDPQARTLITKINQKPTMIALNGYNKAMKEGDEKFKQQSYQTAINKFDEAMTFYAKDAKAASYKRKAQEELAWQAADKINTVESYKSYLAKYPLGKYKSNADDILQRTYLRFARDYVKEKKFSEAVNYYQIYQTSYTNGPQINTVNKELCELYFAEAKKNEKVKQPYNMRLALEQYGLAKKCGINRVSSAHLKSLKRKEVRYGRDNRVFITYAYDSLCKYGVSWGTINNKAVGVYVTARANSEAFTSGGSNGTVDNKGVVTGGQFTNWGNDWRFKNEIKTGTAEVLIGLTKKITYPLWVYAGAGVSYNNQFWQMEIYDNLGDYYDTDWVKNSEAGKLKPVFEAGMIVDLKGFNMRGGVKTQTLKEMTLTLGIGFSLARR